MVKSGVKPGGVAPLAYALSSGGAIPDVHASPSLIMQPLSPLQLHVPAATVDHLLVSPGSRVAVISPDEGLAASHYANLRPHWNVVSWVPDMKTLLRAQNIHQQTNLSFDKLPVAGKKTAQPVDAVLAIGWMHRLYSQNNYALPELVKTVQELLAQLPVNGQLLIQDIALPDDPEQFVLLELEQQNAVQALRDYARQARPQLPGPLRGFFLEQLSSNRAGVARFRLTHKWATEFFHRWRLGVAMDAPVELTTLSLDQWANVAEQFGARASYRAPHALTRIQVQQYGRQIRLYDEREQPLPLPAATFTLLIEKIEASQAVTLYERRESDTPAHDIKLRSTKIDAQKSGDWIEAANASDDLLPWRRDAQGQLRVWLQAGVARPLLNTVPRGTPNLDGRKWAGYLTEPLSVPSLDGPMVPEVIADAISARTSLPQSAMRDVRVAINYYAAPDYLAQRVRGLLAHMNNELPAASQLPAASVNEGRVIEFMADDVLRALSIGLIPDGKLEILISALMQEIGVRPSDLGDMLKDSELSPAKLRAVEMKEAKLPRSVKDGSEIAPNFLDEPTGNFRAIRSVFAEDQSGPFGRQVVRVAEQDFFMPARASANTAVCVPLLRHPLGGFLLSAEPRKLPIPDRYGTGEPMLSLPSFRLPENISDMDQARKFIAQQLACDADDLLPFGPSFFLEPRLSPERVYPFLLRATGQAARWARWFRPQNMLTKLVELNAEKNTASIHFRAQRALGEWYTGFTPSLSAELTENRSAQTKTDVAGKQSNDNAPRGPVPQ